MTVEKINISEKFGKLPAGDGGVSMLRMVYLNSLTLQRKGGDVNSKKI
jgi:hypothetical protein